MKLSLLAWLASTVLFLARAEMNLRIVGGNVVQPGQFKWQVSLQAGGYHYCGGTLVSNRWILTAAHCTDFMPQKIVLGTTDLDSTQDVIERVPAKVILHEGYKPGEHEFDIALIKLNRPVKDIKPIRLAGRAGLSISQPGVMQRVSGWGAMNKKGKYSDVLRVAQVPVVSREDCTGPKSYAQDLIYDSNICAGFAAGKKDACQGDSGGPLFHLGSKNDGSDAVQIGIVSWGDGCGKPNKYGVYTDVGSYGQWAKSKVKAIKLYNPNLGKRKRRRRRRRKAGK